MAGDYDALAASAWQRVLAFPRLFVLVSGGKDSTAALVYTKEVLDRRGSNGELVGLHVDTTIGFPGTEEYVCWLSKRLSLEIVTVKPKIDYFTLAEKWGVPRPKARWCCFELKIRPLRDYLKQFDRDTYIVIDGIRRQESRKRALYPPFYMHKHFGLCFHPIIDWSSDQVDEYLRLKRIKVNPVYKWGFGSWECWCGAFKRKSEFKKLKTACPELFEKLVALESKFRSGFAYAYYGGEPFYLRDI